MCERIIQAISSQSNQEEHDGTLDDEFKNPLLNEVCNYLDSLTQFQKLRNQPDYRKLLRLGTRNLHIRRYNKGEILVRQGDRGDGFFIILSGNVGVFVLHLESTLKKLRQCAKRLAFLREIHAKDTSPEVAELEEQIKKLQQLSPADKVLLERNDCFLKQSASRTEYLVKKVNHLGPNRSFGEFSLAKVRKRTASILAESNEVITAWMPYEVYHQVFDSEIHYKEKLAVLIQTFFQGIGDTHANQISYFMQPRPLLRNQNLYKEGEESSEIYFLEEGNIQLTKVGEKIADVRNRITASQSVKVAILQSGQFFGYELMENQNYFTASGLTNEVKVLALPLAQLFQVPDYNFAKVLSKKSEKSINRYAERLEQINLARQTFHKQFFASSSPISTGGIVQATATSSSPPSVLTSVISEEELRRNDLQSNQIVEKLNEIRAAMKENHQNNNNINLNINLTKQFTEYLSQNEIKQIPLSPKLKNQKSVHFSSISASTSPLRANRQKSKTTIIHTIYETPQASVPAQKELESAESISPPATTTATKSQSFIAIPTTLSPEASQNNNNKELSSQQPTILEGITKKQQISQFTTTTNTTGGQSPVKSYEQHHMFQFSESFSDVKARLIRMKNLNLMRKEKVPTFSGVGNSPTSSPIRKLKKHFTLVPMKAITDDANAIQSTAPFTPTRPDQEEDQQQQQSAMPFSYSCAQFRIPSEKTVPEEVEVCIQQCSSEKEIELLPNFKKETSCGSESSLSWIPNEKQQQLNPIYNSNYQTNSNSPILPPKNQSINPITISSKSIVDPSKQPFEQIAVFSRQSINISESPSLKNSTIMKRIQSLVKKNPIHRNSLEGLQQQHEEHQSENQIILCKPSQPIITTSQHQIQSLSPRIKPLRASLERKQEFKIIPSKQQHEELNLLKPESNSIKKYNKIIIQKTPINQQQIQQSQPCPNLLSIRRSQQQQQQNSIERDSVTVNDSRRDSTGVLTSAQHSISKVSQNMFYSLRQSRDNSIRHSRENSLKDIKSVYYIDNKGFSQQQQMRENIDSLSSLTRRPSTHLLQSMDRPKLSFFNQKADEQQSPQKSMESTRNSSSCQTIRTKIQNLPLFKSTVDSSTQVITPQSYIDTDVLRRTKYTFKQNNLLEKVTVPAEENQHNHQTRSQIQSSLVFSVGQANSPRNDVERETHHGALKAAQLSQLQLFKKHQKQQSIVKNQQQQQQPILSIPKSSRELLAQLSNKSQQSFSIQASQQQLPSFSDLQKALTSRTYQRTPQTSPLKLTRVEKVQSIHEKVQFQV